MSRFTFGRRDRRDRQHGRSVGCLKLLDLDAAYSLEMIQARKMEHEITCRDLDGFFEHVWSVHPMVGASPEHSRSFSVGSPSATLLAARHTVLEGRVGQFRWLEILPALNFLLSQAVLTARLLRLIRHERISIIRAGDPYYHGLLGLLLARLSRLPLVVRITANQDSIYDATGELTFPRLFRFRAIERRIAHFVLRRADLVAAGSENNRHFALANGARPERSTLFRYGTWIDPVHFRTEPAARASVRSELQIGDRPFVVLVSRLERVKHPEDVLRVLVEAQRRQPHLAAVFVGDGTMREDLAATAAELGIGESVRFVGNREQPWIAAALTSASVVLSPLTGRALVEASLSGTPVVAYDVEWHSELVSTGETGMLVPYRDTVAMAAAVCALAEDTPMASMIGKNARVKALEMMDPERLMDHERGQYLQLLRRTGPGG